MEHRFAVREHKLAVASAGLYWVAVAASYLAALLIRDEDGLAYGPFMFLSLPWSALVYELTNHISNHGVAAAVFALASWLLSGINAVALYLIVGKTSHLLLVMLGKLK
jgi:hypothetical protein